MAGDSALDAADATTVASDSDVPLNCANVQEGQACSVEGQSCGGPCNNPCEFCNVWRCSGGRWARLEVFPMPCSDGGPAVDVPNASSDVVVTDSSFRPDPTAIVLIQEQGGFAGTGPAIAVRGDGSVYVWTNQRGVRLDALDLASARMAPAVAPERVAELLAIWQATSRVGLPHGPGRLECGVSVEVKACAGCITDRLSYVEAAQVSPELNTFWQWYMRNVMFQIGENPPSSYCSGGL